MSKNSKHIKVISTARKLATPKDVLYTPEGQWKYPGQVTKIPGDTMATNGYGNIPLWTVPDVGDPRMVYPDTGTQYFEGASNFTEYPQMHQMPDGSMMNNNEMRTGGWLDEYNEGGPKKGREPIQVSDTNDPRLKAYKDSLSLYNSSNYKPKGHVLIDKDKMTDGIHQGSIGVPFINSDTPWSTMFRKDKIKPIGMDTYDLPSSAGKNIGTDFTIPVYKKPVQPYTYKKQVVELIPETIKEQPKSIEVPKKDYATRHVNFSSPYGPVMEYYDAASKLIRTEPYKAYGGIGPMSSPKLKKNARKFGTAKNIQSSINKVFLRNHDLFGPSGRNIYNPTSKYEEGGGWLDQYQMGAAATTGATPVSTKAPINPTNPEAYEGMIDFVARKWKNRDPNRDDPWELMMPDGQGGYTGSGVTPFDAILSAPQQIVKAVSAGKALFTGKSLPGKASQAASVSAEMKAAQAAKEAAAHEAMMAKAFPTTAHEEVSKPFMKAKVKRTDEEALQDVMNVDDWYNWENKYMGKNIAFDKKGNRSGFFNQGVYEIEGHPKYVAKVEDPIDNVKMLGQDYMTTNLEELHKSITSPNVAKILKEITHPGNPAKKLLIMKKIPGKALHDVPVTSLKKIPADAWKQLDADARELRNKGFAIDFSGDNILYDSKTKKFGIIDVSPSPSTMPEMSPFWQSTVLKGVDKSLPNNQSAKYLREGITARLENAFSRSGADFYHDYKKATDASGAVRADQYRDAVKALSNRKTFELQRLLAKQPVEKLGGGWLDNLY